MGLDAASRRRRGILACAGPVLRIKSAFAGNEMQWRRTHRCRHARALHSDRLCCTVVRHDAAPARACITQSAHASCDLHEMQRRPARMLRMRLLQLCRLRLIIVRGATRTGAIGTVCPLHPGASFAAIPRLSASTCFAEPDIDALFSARTHPLVAWPNGCFGFRCEGRMCRARSASSLSLCRSRACDDAHRPAMLGASVAIGWGGVIHGRGSSPRHAASPAGRCRQRARGCAGTATDRSCAAARERQQCLSFAPCCTRRPRIADPSDRSGMTQSVATGPLWRSSETS
jgi:hypothetical protein